MFGDEARQPLRQGYSAALDADQHHAFAAVALFHDLVRQPHQRALDFRGRHEPALGAQGVFPFSFAHRVFPAVSLDG